MAKAKRASSGKKKRGKAKGVRKKRTKRSKPTKVVYHSTKEIKVEKALIENFIGLQRVMVNLSARFEALSKQISRLLNLFEASAKTLAERESFSGDLDAKRVMKKLENLSQQAGLIGKGLALIHEVGTETERPTLPPGARGSRPQPQFPSPMASPGVSRGVSVMQPPQKKMTRELGEFEKTEIKKEQKFGEGTNAGANP